MKLIYGLTIASLVVSAVIEIFDIVKTRRRKREINYINSVMSSRDEESPPLLIENIRQVTKDVMDINEGKITLPYRRDFVIDDSEPTERDGFTYYVQTTVNLCFGKDYVCTVTTSKFNKNVLRVIIKKELIM